MNSSRGIETEPVERLISALRHPLRGQILALLSDRSASAAELAEALDEPASKIRYHLRALAKSGLIGSAEKRDRRGAREHRWISRTRQLVEDHELPDLSAEEVRHLIVFFLRLLFNDAEAGLRSDSFTRRTDNCLIRMRPEIDQRGWKELVGIFRSALADIQTVSERASGRLAKSGEDPMVASASLVLFELEEPHRAVPAAVRPGR